MQLLFGTGPYGPITRLISIPFPKPGTGMPGIKEIPDEVRWRFAAQCAATLPTLCDIAFRGALGKKYEPLEQEIWTELSRMVVTIAHDCSLPKQNAREIADTLHTALIVLFGPEQSGETIELSGDNAVIVVRRCPFLFHSCTLATDCGHSFARCMALVLAAVPLLNKEYEGRFVRAICTGDRQCEIRIGRKPPAKV